MSERFERERTRLNDLASLTPNLIDCFQGWLGNLVNHFKKHLSIIELYRGKHFIHESQRACVRSTAPLKTKNRKKRAMSSQNPVKKRKQLMWLFQAVVSRKKEWVEGGITKLMKTSFQTKREKVLFVQISKRVSAIQPVSRWKKLFWRTLRKPSLRVSVIKKKCV